VKLTEEMKCVVRGQRLGYVASVCPDGTPNLSPKGTVAVWDDEHLVFADIRSPRTVVNLRRNPSVEINVVDPFLRKGYRFKGIAEIIDGGDLFEEILSFYSKGITDARKRVKSIVLVKVEYASALISPAYDLGMSEEEITERWEKYYQNLRKGILVSKSPD
jgi:predicted pyridoxine 5'-phosphate oxidase superfamily flavin-nucleotide-binding protein